MIKNILAEICPGLEMGRVHALKRLLSVPLLLVLAAGTAPGEGTPVPVARDVPHAIFTGLLQSHRDAEGRVDYAAWRKDPVARAALDHYLATFDSTPRPAATGRELMAGWINLYHASLIRGILQQPGLGSPKGDPGFFSERRHRVGTTTFSLADLSESCIVPVLGWRARGVLHLGCYGGPPLPDTAPEAGTLDAVIDGNWRRWLARPDQFRADASVIRLPQTFLWHKGEFEADGGYRAVLGRYLPPESAAWVARKDIRVEYLPFDWTLASADTPPRSYSLGRMLRDRWWPW